MKDWLTRFGYRVAEWMQGRNGMDTMANWSLGLAIVLIVVAFILNSYIVNILAMVPMVYAIFRCYSKNIAKRREENAAFEKRVEGPTKWFSLQYKKVKNRKTTCYFTCPDCKAVYSVPKGKGRVRATCPKCHSLHEHTT